MRERDDGWDRIPGESMYDLRLRQFNETGHVWGLMEEMRRHEVWPRNNFLDRERQDYAKATGGQYFARERRPNYWEPI